MEIFENKVYREADKPAKTIMCGIDETEVGPPPIYGGNADALNPEEMFVASINSCIMLVFDHFARKYEVKLALYSSTAKGVVEKTRNGLRFTSVDVNAQVQLVNATDAEKIDEISKLAEKYCLVSNSVACPVSYKVSIINN